MVTILLLRRLVVQWIRIDIGRRRRRRLHLGGRHRAWRRLHDTTCQSQAGQGRSRHPGQRRANARLGPVHHRACSLEAHCFRKER